MKNILVFDQSGRFTSYCDSIAVGRRNPKGVIGDEVSKLLEKNNLSIDELIKKCNNEQYFGNLSNLINSLSETNEGKNYLVCYCINCVRSCVISFL